MAKNFIYPITTGRTGTTYLATLLHNNLQDSKVYHERAYGLDFGVHSPDASDFAYFNTVGNVPKVQQFWQRKLALDAAIPESIYVEISHVLVKAGLIENLSVLYDNPDNKIHLVILKRDIKKIAWSFYNRLDFYNAGFTYLWYLDYRYKNVIISFTQFAQFDMAGFILWYIHEMYTRAAYYKLILQDIPNVIIHEIDLSEIIRQPGVTNFIKDLALPLKQEEIIIPEKINDTKQFVFSENDKLNLDNLCDRIIVDHEKLAKEFYDSGRRLASPPALGSV